MRFRFTLEPVLRVARVREECEWTKLQSIQTEINTIIADMQALAAAQLGVRRQLATDVMIATPAAIIHAANTGLASMQQRERELQHKVRAAQERFADQQRVYIAFRQKREALSTVRAARLAEFRRELARKEQLALDDIFLNRRR
jgi:flagellar export protein FliJ